MKSDYNKIVIFIEVYKGPGSTVVVSKHTIVHGVYR